MRKQEPVAFPAWVKPGYCMWRTFSFGVDTPHGRVIHEVRVGAHVKPAIVHQYMRAVQRGDAA